MQKRVTNSRQMKVEKRTVGIVHEFLSLTLEKMVEVEKISHFRKWFGIDLNMRDLFLDHLGIFCPSTKGKRHTVFSREACERGCLIVPNPVYDIGRKLLNLGGVVDEMKMATSQTVRNLEKGMVQKKRTNDSL